MTDAGGAEVAALAGEGGQFFLRNHGNVNRSLSKSRP